MKRRTLTSAAVLLVLTGAAAPANAKDWYVATDGAPAGEGTPHSPWDIGPTLAGRRTVDPGDTIWIRSGTYKYPGEVGSMGYPVKLAGREGAPVHVRALPGERVTIDGGLNLQAPSTHLWIWDLEIMVSEPRPDGPVPPDPSYRNVNRPWGGLNVYSGTGCKFINLIIHDNSQGMSWWIGSTQSEVHGCIFYDNGWAGTDRGHGHAIYTQNNEGVKKITDCLFTGGFGYLMHAYGSSRAYVNNYLAQGNVAYRAGTFLVGGGRPSHGIQVISNFLCDVSLQLGYSAPTNVDCVVRGNLIVNGSLNLNRFGHVVNEGNRVITKSAARPSGAEVILRPNGYDMRRANLAIFNWTKKPRVPVDLSAFMEKGERFRLMDPRDFFGQPVWTGTCGEGPVLVPVEGEFAAFVLLK